ncbi:MAG: MoxR family ATPase [Archangium sp.]|nr:MoxR family ATPase [Archangium sp.]
MSGTPLSRLETALSEVVLGQSKVLADLLTAFLARGHVLLEGVPGVAKTLTARTLANALGLSFARIQFTPDLMPSDVIGTSVFRPNDGTFQLVKGPVFTEVLVADEINRTPPKTQAALLEAMEERQVTIDGTSHQLAPWFFVVATQNPLELEGTYPLPEAQLDRFLMRVRVSYPDEAAERSMLQRSHERGGKNPTVAKITNADELNALQTAAGAVKCDASIVEYVLKLIRATREERRVKLGASPRAGQALLASAKARAALLQRDFVTPDEVKAVAASVLNHRLMLKAEAEVEGVSADDVIARVLEQVPVPR